MIDLKKLNDAMEAASRNGMSANKLAEKADIHPVSLSNIRTGKTKHPKSENIRALEAALHLNKYDLELSNQRKPLDNNLLYLQSYILTFNNLLKGEDQTVPASIDWLSKAEKIGNVFSVKVVGDIFLPKYPNDTELIVEPVQIPTHKQQVVYKKDGQFLLRRTMIQGAHVALWPVNAQDGDIITINMDDISSPECELYRILKITNDPD